MKEDEYIEVKKRSTNKVYFESPLVQSIYDKIDFLREESKSILEEIDSSEFKQQLDNINLEEFSEDTINQIDDVFDDISRFKDDIIETQDIPENVREPYRMTQMYFDRDGDYVRRAQRKLKRLKSNKLTDAYGTYSRVIELCDKAIKVNDCNFDAYFLKAQTLVKMRRYAEAIEEFNNALSIKKDIRVLLAIGEANRLDTDFDGAINAYNKALSMDENSFEAFKGKAYTYFDLKDFKTAAYFFGKASHVGSLDEASQKIWNVCKEKLN